MAEKKENKQKSTFVQFLLFIVMSLAAFAVQFEIVQFGPAGLKLCGVDDTLKMDFWIFKGYTLAAFISFLVANTLAKIISYILNRKKTFNAVNNLVFSMTVYVIMCVTLIIVETLIGEPLANAYANLFESNPAIAEWAPTMSMITYSIADFLIVFLMEKFVIMNDNLFKKKNKANAEDEAEAEEVADEAEAEKAEEVKEEAVVDEVKDEEPVAAPVEEVKEEEKVEEPAEEKVEEEKVEEPVQEEAKAEEPAKEEVVVEEAKAEEPTKEEVVVEEAKAEEPAAIPVVEEKVEEPVKEEAPAKKAPAKKSAKKAKEETKAEEPAKEEVKAEEPAKEEAKAEEPKKAPAKKTTKKANAGKVEFDLRVDGYHFEVSAMNGQLMFESQGFASLETAKTGFETFKAALEDESTPATVYEDKRGLWRFVINKRYVGEGYKTRAQAEAAIDSVKRDALFGKIEDYVEDPEEKKAFNEAKKKLNKGAGVDWDTALKAPAKTFGKFEINGHEGRGYFFTLYANNGQILYCSRYYASQDSCEDAITTFKKACYLDNFFIDKDKFGNWRFVLKGTGAGIVYVGESYSTKDAAISSSESVKKFAMTAKIVVVEDED